MEPGRAPGWGTSTPLVSAPRARRSIGAVGLLLDGRYRLEQRRTRDGASSSWDGSDDQLGRPVSVLVVAGSTAPAAVDAARRCAALDDERLARVLDVGSSQAADGGALGWVVTERAPGSSLAELLRSAPLRAERVRAIVGEATAALARAAEVGLHHRRLDPASVVVSERGDVVVSGLEVAAAAAGLAPSDPEQAEREDAVGLVSLLYAGLTGLWPHGRFSALGAAPTSAGSPVPPGDLVGGVPGDLDTLSMVTLGLYDDGPRSPGELAEQLAPWGSAASWGSTPVDGPLDLDPADHTDLDAADHLDAVERAGTDDVDFDALGSTALHQPVFVEPGLRSGGSSARGAGAADGSGAWPQGWASATPDDARAWDGEDLARAPGQDWEGEEAPVRRGGGRVVLAVVALAVIALLVVAGLNAHRITRVFGGSPAGSSTPAASSAPAGSPAASPSAAGPTSTAPPSAPAAALAVTGVRALDPLGDGSENDDEVDRATDGDPSTAWSSSTYTTAAFGGLKTGLGLSLDLGRTATVRSLDVSVAGTGGSLQVRASGDGAYSASSPVLATAAVGAVGGSSVHVTLAHPTTTRYVVLWFTRLPRTSTGYSAQVAEVSVH